MNRLIVEIAVGLVILTAIILAPFALIVGLGVRGPQERYRCRP